MSYDLSCVKLPVSLFLQGVLGLLSFLSESVFHLLRPTEVNFTSNEHLVTVKSKPSENRETQAPWSALPNEGAYSAALIIVDGLVVRKAL